MRLILSSRHPRNSTYTNETGQVLYKVDKPLRFAHHGTATIRKAVSTVNGVWHGDHEKLLEPRAKSPFSDKHSVDSRDKEAIVDGDRHSIDGDFADSESEGEAEPSTKDLPALEGHFAFYARVEFHGFDSARFHYDNKSVESKDFFRKEKWSWFGRGRIFKASDGQEYRWDLRAGHIEMVRNDENNTQVVRFREWRPNLGPVMNGRPASLEIDPSCEPIIDEIIMTFVYCHKLRKDRQESQRRAGH